MLCARQRSGFEQVISGAFRPADYASDIFAVPNSLGLSHLLLPSLFEGVISI